LITETADRLGKLVERKNLFVVCGKLHAAPTRRWVKGIPARNIIVEPAARNTAPAIGLAALHVALRDPQGVMAVLPSDHHVADVAGFQRTLSEAAKLARDGLLVTLGIQPTRPETGYGYLRVGESLKGNARRVAAFVEKPDLAKAQSYLQSGDYLWNGGIFVFRADRILEELHEHLPEVAEGLDVIAKAMKTRGASRVLAKVFPKLPSVSIDYGVMEKAQDIAVLPGDFGWSDLGSFAALPEVRPHDAQGNVVSGKGPLLIDCHDCVVVGSGRPLALVGMRGVVAVDSGDAVLILPRERNQDVREVVAALGKDRALARYL
jgi:mannose-1-phosphate guanylyltransferase